ncbi:MAG: type II toxin-antitoxin system RelB/DinJ family antitoxin [Lactobacillus sp.]|jgi:DNA-damage-inducible protein J|nr:type II toxin-antitoxin system RelB/DinJ family antitoxin [Lactobacillus sp.]MCI1466752.1 type II toxin-antitoxin system RelB/DinJ family antitoxin [Lactobacillus sp.]MCI1527174.1 type II toxin-antitoxin system RelB/DinJ family antitoxin [Lactobacillus sp.]MCI1884078.1 type II toxin-antitoxin system RelB/DinJ family antitoxin [Lactobacillus sp.]
MNFKTDPTTKKHFTEVAENLGLTSSALLNIFVKRVAREQAVPFELKVVPDKSDLDIDEESKKEMIRQLAIINGLIPDDDNRVDNLDAYFKRLGD